MTHEEPVMDSTDEVDPVIWDLLCELFRRLPRDETPEPPGPEPLI